MRSRELLDSGFNCAESVLLAVAESRGVGCKLIPGIATGFCSGVARTGGLCGAVGGATLAIGVALGRTAPSQCVEICYQAVREMKAAFTDEFGSDNCQVLTGCHLGTDEGRARYKEQHLRARCFNFAAEATRLALESIERAAA